MSKDRLYVKLVNTKALEMNSDEDLQRVYVRFLITPKIREGFSSEDRKYLLNYGLDINSNSLWAYVPEECRHCFQSDVDVELILSMVILLLSIWKELIEIEKRKNGIS